jgi:hypothetical protein
MNLANTVQAPDVVGEAQLPIMYQNRQVVLFNTLPLFGAAWQKKCSRSISSNSTTWFWPTRVLPSFWHPVPNNKRLIEVAQ